MVNKIFFNLTVVMSNSQWRSDGSLSTTVNPVLLATATNTVVCNRNDDENANVGVQL